MEVNPTPEQEAFIRDALANRRLRRPEEALREALSLWEERERRRGDSRRSGERGNIACARRGPQSEEPRGNRPTRPRHQATWHGAVGRRAEQARMSEFRLSPEAEDQFDAIWLHIARESAVSTSPAASLTV
jgi:hypothetical protein